MITEQEYDAIFDAVRAAVMESEVEHIYTLAGANQLITEICTRIALEA